MTKWLGPLAILFTAIVLIATIDEALSRNDRRFTAVEQATVETAAVVSNVQEDVGTISEIVQTHQVLIEDHERRLRLIEDALTAILRISVDG